MIGIDSPTDLMQLLRIDLEMNVWVVPCCGFNTNIKNGSSTDVEIKALGISGPCDFHKGTWRALMSVSNMNLNIQTFMSVGYHIFEYIYRDKPQYKDVYRDNHKYKEKLKVTYSFNLLIMTNSFEYF